MDSRSCGCPETDGAEFHALQRYFPGSLSCFNAGIATLSALVSFLPFEHSFCFCRLLLRSRSLCGCSLVCAVVLVRAPCPPFLPPTFRSLSLPVPALTFAWVCCYVLFNRDAPLGGRSNDHVCWTTNSSKLSYCFYDMRLTPKSEPLLLHCYPSICFLQDRLQLPAPNPQTRIPANTLLCTSIGVFNLGHTSRTM